MQIQMITDRLRTLVGAALASSRYDHVVPVRKAREALATVNDLAGRPFCTSAELEERHTAEQQRVADLKEPAPVIVYFDGKDHRTKVKVEELLQSRSIEFRTLDVGDDEATRSFAETASKSKEFPLVFIAGNAVGGLHELQQLDVNGELSRRVFGA